MPEDGFRFVHVTNLRIDEPLSGIGSVSGQDRETIVEATLTAWDRVVETAIAQMADFVIISGNAFDHRTQSLRGQVSLYQGLKRLDSHQIDVFIVPGFLDPASAWERSINLPPNATLIQGEENDPVAVVKNGRMLAVLNVIATAETDESRWSDASPAVFQSQTSTYQIGIVPAGVPVRWNDGYPEVVEAPGVSPTGVMLIKAAIQEGVNYLACGSGDPMTAYAQRSLIHDPGPPQAFNSNINGPCGCSLVEIHSDGETEISHIPLSPVTFEDFDLKIHNSLQMGELAEQMALLLLDRNIESTTETLIVSWNIEVPINLVEFLTDHSNLSELWNSVDEVLAEDLNARCIHRLARVSRSFASDQEEELIQLTKDFRQRIDFEAERILDQTKLQMASEAWLQRSDMQHVREVIQQADRFEITQSVDDIAGQTIGST